MASTNTTEVEAVATALCELPGIETAIARDRNRYSCLPYCILAAIFSINARYSVVRSTVDRYRHAYQLPSLRAPDVEPGTREPTVSDLIGHIEAVGVEKFAADVLHNRMRTSSRSGILKAAAALETAKALRDHGIERISDVLAYPDPTELEAALRRVRGQSRGISTQYFFMNVGDTMRVKPDRWIVAFLERVLGRSVTTHEAQQLFLDVCPRLDTEHPGISPRALDLLVWNTERVREKPQTNGQRESLMRRIAATERRLAQLRAKLAKSEAGGAHE